MHSTLLRALASLLPLAIAAGCSGAAPGGGDDATGDDDPGDPDGGGGGGDDGGVGMPPDASPPDARTPAVLGVCAGGGAEYTRIADAIAAAYSGDSIEVCPGTYRERLLIEGKELRLVGLQGAASTILDAESAGVPLTVRQAAGTGVTIEGFTIRGGSTDADGGGLRCENSTLAIRATTFSANRAAGGGGLFAMACTVDIDGARFEQNTSSRTGGGALFGGGAGTVRNSVFLGNQSVNGAGLAIYEGTYTLDRNELRGNIAGLRGGALYANAPVTVTGNQVIDNQAGWTGGGLQLHGHAPLVENNLIQGNTAINDGGGVYAGNTEITMRMNTIRNNRSGDDGGGIRIFECPCTLEANLVEGNAADDSGAGVRISHVPCTVIDNIVRDNESGGTGGGFDLDNDASTLRGGEISGNIAHGAGGGIFAWLGPFNGHTIENVLIKENRAWKGGGLYVEDNFKPVKMRGLTVVGNRAGHGGGLYIRGTNYTLVDSLFAGNRGSRTGGAIAHAYPEPWTDPCGMPPDTLPCPPTDPTGLVQFVVIHGNESPQGAGIWVDGDHLTVESSILFDQEGPQVSVVAWEDAPPDMPVPPFPPDWRYNDTFPATFEGMGDPTGSSGNLATDPLFANVAGGDYHLTAGSACIDAGPPGMQDQDGTRADMGLIGGAP